MKVIVNGASLRWRQTCCPLGEPLLRAWAPRGALRGELLRVCAPRGARGAHHAWVLRGVHGALHGAPRGARGVPRAWALRDAPHDGGPHGARGAPHAYGLHGARDVPRACVPRGESRGVHHAWGLHDVPRACEPQLASPRATSWPIVHARL